MTDHPHDAAPPAHDPLDTFPWDTAFADEGAPPTGSAEPAPRQRHDAFTEAKKSAFLTALVKTGCVLDACRVIGVSARTVYRHQESDPRFADHCSAALRMSATPLELTAWQRAVEGVEQEFACGGQVHVRRRYDSSLLRLLLQGSNPKKYGARPGFKRKRLYRHEKKQMEREIRAEIRAEMPTFDQSMELLEKRLRALKIPITQGSDEHSTSAPRSGEGGTMTPDEHWVPPGYGPIPGWQPPMAWEGGAEPPAIPCDSRATRDFRHLRAAAVRARPRLGPRGRVSGLALPLPRCPRYVPPPPAGGAKPMDAPKGRYRIEEKDGRLVVTDTFTGAPISQPPPQAPGARSAGPLSPRAPGLRDRFGRMLLRLVVRRWDDAGRAVIAWEWDQNGRRQSWNAILDSAQQRRLGRALNAIAAFPILVLLLVLGAWALFPLAFLALGISAWGVMSILRLQRDTGGVRGPEG